MDELRKDLTCEVTGGSFSGSLKEERFLVSVGFCKFIEGIRCTLVSILETSLPIESINLLAECSRGRDQCGCSNCSTYIFITSLIFQRPFYALHDRAYDHLAYTLYVRG